MNGINLKGDDIHQKVHVSCLLYSLDKYKDLFQEQMKTNIFIKPAIISTIYEKKLKRNHNN